MCILIIDDAKQKIIFHFQDSKSLNNTDEDNDEHAENESLENGRNTMTGSPDSSNSRNDKDLEDLMEVEHQVSYTTKSC